MEPPHIRWTADGAPINDGFDDIYFSLEDGRAESEHVFLSGCGLPEAFTGRARFTTAELGFGLGLTTACLLTAWRAAPDRPPLRIVSFEIAPAALDVMAQALAPWPDCAELLDRLAPVWPPHAGVNRIELHDGAEMELHIGDANELVPAWDDLADAWFLDGFSPAKNPQLWGNDLLSAVYERTAPGGAFATYAAAGWVRRNLQAAGFEVARAPGYGRKREMLTGRRPEQQAQRSAP